MSFVFVCTRDDRLIRLAAGDGSWTARTALEGLGAQCVATRGDQVLVGTRGNGLHVSDDGGERWRRVELPEPDVLSVAFSDADGARYAGTEPSRLFVARDGGAWTELEALQDIPSRSRWSFPPRPWTHHVRWIAPDPHHAERLLAGIELGGVMYTEDGGASFADHRPGAKLDAHMLAWHPVADGRAYQAAGDGAAWSRDAGRSWQSADAGRDLRYCWALAVDPHDPERWYVSAAAGPGAAHSDTHARGRLYRWDDGTWHTLDLPLDAMPYALAAANGGLVCGLADGRLMTSSDDGETWAEHADVGSVAAMAVAA